MGNKVNLDSGPQGKSLPRLGVPLLCLVQHFNTKGKRYAVLKRVKESDCSWRLVDDNSELSYDWGVMRWWYLPKIKD